MARLEKVVIAMVDWYLLVLALLNSPLSPPIIKQKNTVRVRGAFGFGVVWLVEEK